MRRHAVCRYESVTPNPARILNVPRCSYHPDVETGLRCAECDKPICPKEMVTTAVGYKCPECARTPQNALGGTKPRQYLGAVGAGAAAAIIGGLHHPHDGHIAPADLTMALRKGARAKGAEVYEQTEVTAVARTRSGEWKLTTTKGERAQRSPRPVGRVRRAKLKRSLSAPPVKTQPYALPRRRIPRRPAACLASTHAACPRRGKWMSPCRSRS